MAGSRFEEIVIQSGICASGFLEQVMNGKHFNRALRIRQPVLAAVKRLLLHVFVDRNGIDISSFPEQQPSRKSRGTPPAVVKGSCAPSVRSHGTCTMFLRYPCTLHCRHANPCSWSGVLNLLKFDLTPKKKNASKVNDANGNAAVLCVKTWASFPLGLLYMPVYTLQTASVLNRMCSRSWVLSVTLLIRLIWTKLREGSCIVSLLVARPTWRLSTIC